MGDERHRLGRARLAQVGELLPLSGCGNLLFEWVPYDLVVRVVDPFEAELCAQPHTWRDHHP